MAIKQKPKKVGRPTNQSRKGRKPVMTETIVNKLEQAFAFGCTDIEACLFAGISRPTLYKYEAVNPKFIARKEELKQTPVLLARQSVIKHMDNDGDLALKYLERKVKSEFSPRSEVQGNFTVQRMETVKVNGELQQLNFGKNTDLIQFNADKMQNNSD